MTKEPLFREKQRFFFIKLLASFALRFAALLFFDAAISSGNKGEYQIQHEQKDNNRNENANRQPVEEFRYLIQCE